MKKTITFIIIFLLLAGITIALIFLEPKNLLNNIPYLNKLFINTTLTINSPNSKVKIYINDQDYGESNQTISDLPEGNYDIRLRRVTDGSSETNLFYEEANFKVNLANNTESIINVEIGPDGLLYGYILYYVPIETYEKDSAMLSIFSENTPADISLDNVYLATTPINRIKKEPSSYKLSATQTGYQAIEIPIITRKGYNLNVYVYLFPIPDNISY